MNPEHVILAVMATKCMYPDWYCYDCPDREECQDDEM